MALRQATSFATRHLHLGGDAEQAAQDAVSGVWEDARFGRVSVDGVAAFQAEVSARLYKIAGNIRGQARRSVSLDAPVTRDDETASSLLDAGWKGHHPASQFNVVYFKEIQRGTALLPERQRVIMELMQKGYNAADIASELRISVHTVFRRTEDARRALFLRDLIGMASDL